MDTQFKLGEGEKLELDLKPQKSLILYNTVSNAIGQIVTIVAIFIGVYYKLIYEDHNKMGLSADSMIKAAIACVVLIVVIFFFRWFINSIKVGKLRYIFTDQRCVIYSGFIGINKQVIPYNRIADVDISQSTMEAMFSISTLEIDEQAMNVSSDTSVEGLSREDAEAITEVVSKHIVKKQV